jgi:lambda family phage tail tape measure protein
MATDIAKIGFGVETSQLEKGVATLNTFSASAKSANNSAKSVGTAMNGAAKVFAAAVAGMSKSIASLVSVTQGVTAEQIKAANEAAEFADRVYRAAQAQDKLAASTQKVTAAVKGQYSAFLKMASNESVLNRINRITGVTGLYGGSAMTSAMAFRQNMNKKEWTEATGGLYRDMMPNRFNTANVAAQFQDIAVTASMGMNPLLIALQQGTQLSAVLNSMEKPIQGLADAFKQIINPTSLWTIALTALAVVGLQMVDWSGLATDSLGLLSDAMGFASDNVEIFTAALAGLSFAGIVTGISSFSSVVSGLGKILSPILGFLTKLVILLAGALTSKFTIIAAIITGLVYAISKLRSYLEDTLGFDISFGLWDKLTSLIKSATDALKEFFSVSDTNTEGWDKISQGITEELDKLQEKHMSLSMSDKESDEFLKRMELYRQAVKEGVNLNDNYGLFNKSGYELIDEYAKSYANWNEKIRQTEESIRNAEKALEAWNDLVEKNNQNIESSKLEQRLIGVDTYTSEYEKTRQDMINKAIQGGINVTDVVNIETGETYLDKINESADGLARTREETEKLNNSFNNAKSITGSFFQDLRQDLWDGVGAWQAFGNAALNVLDNILSKMLDIGVDYLFDAVGAAGTSGGKEKFSWSSVASSIGSWFSGSSAPAAAANGGAFTNGVYNSPTLFKFANGGQFGVMGEAGPEAVMPLRRGPDGSLGVQADGVGKDVVVNVYNNSNTQASVNQRQTSQGTEIDVMIDQIVAEKMGQPGTSSNSALTAFSNRRLITR